MSAHAHRTLCALALLGLVACDDPAAGPAGSGSAPASAAAPSSLAPASSAKASEAQRERVRSFFEDVAARSVAAVEAATKAGAKSRAGYAEAAALSTPAAFYSHADLFEKYGLTLDKFDAVMQDDAFADEVVKVSMQPLREKLSALGELPKTDEADCTRLARRMVELAAQGPKTSGLRAALGGPYSDCVGELPKHVTACIPDPTAKLDLDAYDACVAKGAPATSATPAVSASSARPAVSASAKPR